MRNLVLSLVAIGLPRRSHQSVVEGKADIAAKRLGPGCKALLLARDKSVQRVEHQGPDPCQRTLLCGLPDQIIQHRDQETFGLARPRAARNQNRLRLLRAERSEEHTSELQSLMRISYAVFCLKKKTNKHKHDTYSQEIVTHN